MGALYGPAELRSFLLERVKDGYVFPLNPKWVLCDAGWYDVYEALCNAPHAKQALDAWLPPQAGLRERLSEIHAAHPDGFVRLPAEEGAPDEAGVNDNTWPWRS